MTSSSAERSTRTKSSAISEGRRDSLKSERAKDGLPGVHGLPVYLQADADQFEQEHSVLEADQVVQNSHGPMLQAWIPHSQSRVPVASTTFGTSKDGRSSVASL